MIVKVCGMREGENIRNVEASGVDWMGFIFVPRSPRYVNDIPDYLPTKCRRVGVFVNAPIEYVTSKIQEFELNIIQLHGNESPEYCQALRSAVFSLRTKIIKMLPIGTKEDLAKTNLYAHIVDYFLFETKVRTKEKNYYGGSGLQFDWSILSDYQGNTPFLLTGGIGPKDVENICQFHHPQLVGIDINSLFETSPGVKDADSIHTFIQEVNSDTH